MIAGASCSSTSGETPDASADGASPDATMDGGLADARGDGGGADATSARASPDGGADVLSPDVAETGTRGETGAGDASDAAPPPWRAWPDCPPDYIDPNGIDVPPDAGPCAPPALVDAGDGGYFWSDAGLVWTTSEECDQCLRGTNGSQGYCYLQAAFPPCSDLRDAGTVASGPAAGQAKFDLCAALYGCFLRTACWHDFPQNCYCGDADIPTACQSGAANGPCKTEEENAMQTTDPMYIGANFGNGTTTVPSWVASDVNLLFGCARTPGVCPACVRTPDGGP